MGIKSASSSTLVRSYFYSLVPLLRFRYGAHLFKKQVAELVAPHRVVTPAHARARLFLVRRSFQTHTAAVSWKITSVPVSKLTNTSACRTSTTGGPGRWIQGPLSALSATRLRAAFGTAETVAPTIYFASQRTRAEISRKSSSEAAVTTNATSGARARVLSRRDGDSDDGVRSSFVR